MTNERWKQVADIFDAAQEKSGGDRAAFVQQATDDSTIRREVESLLLAEDLPVVLDEPLDATVQAVFVDNAGVEPGTTIGVYRVESLIGAGGMGEVYRARDTRLDRNVAIKVLPSAFASDADRLARFKREAQVLASLNHPHIAAIYGFEEADGRHALILELVEGRTLAERLQVPGRALPITEALAFARQIADALGAAHEQGIVHRDLKPANITVRDDGTLKVLDFGLAKVVASGPRPHSSFGGQGVSGDGGSEYPEQSRGATSPGMILGTAAYMSPEQAKGKPADRRSDIWAFGCVLYEMLTGGRPFAGEDVSDTLATILRSEPDWAALPAETPPAIRRLLTRCLAKDPRRRIGDAAVLRLEIDDAAVEIDTPVVQRPGQDRVNAAGWRYLVLAAGVATAIGVYALVRTPPAADRPELRVEIDTPPTREAPSVALSPDGMKLVYAADNNGRSQLWLRELGTGATRALDGTTDGRLPFWSPNSRSIGFVADRRLKRLDIAGGPPRDLAAAPTLPRGAAWGPDGTILFTDGPNAGLSRVHESGGPVQEATAVNPSLQVQQGHRGPAFLPDGRHFLFYAVGPGASRGIYVGSIDRTPPRRLLDADSSAVFSQGHLLFARGTMLLAQAFDSTHLTVTGEAFQVAPSVSSSEFVAGVSASNSGAVAFRAGGPGDRRQLIWFDRAGKRLDALGDPDVGTRLSGVELSPDGGRVATARLVNGSRDLWVFELSRRLWTRITTSDGNSQPVWSADGSRLALSAQRQRTPDLMVRPATPDGAESLVFASEAMMGLTDWSSDSNYLIFNSTPPGKGQDIAAYSFAERRTLPLVSNPGEEGEGKLSPDGKWLAYQSNESGRFEIYVLPFPGAARRFQVSNAGGVQARWRADGRELFYIDLQGRLVAVEVKPSPKGAGFEVGTSETLFPVNIPGGIIQTGGNHQQYAVSANGQRFLVNTLLSDAAPTPITLILNWHPTPQTAPR